MKLQVAALQREVSTLRDSLKAKDAALTNAQEDGSTQVQELQVARQGLLHRLETTEQQMQVQNMLLRLPASTCYVAVPNCSNVSVAHSRQLADCQMHDNVP